MGEETLKRMGAGGGGSGGRGAQRGLGIASHQQKPKTTNFRVTAEALSWAGTAQPPPPYPPPISPLPIPPHPPPSPKNPTTLSKTSEIFNEATAAPLPSASPNSPLLTPKRSQAGGGGGEEEGGGVKRGCGGPAEGGGEKQAGGCTPHPSPPPL